MPSWSSDVSWDTRITNWNFEWPPRGIGLRGVALYHSIITPFRCVTFTRGPKYSLHRAGQSRGRAKMMRKTYVAFWALHINAWLFFDPLTKSSLNFESWIQLKYRFYLGPEMAIKCKWLINNQVICNEACDHKIKVLCSCLFCQKPMKAYHWRDLLYPCEINCFSKHRDEFFHDLLEFQNWIMKFFIQFHIETNQLVSKWSLIAKLDKYFSTNQIELKIHFRKYQWKHSVWISKVLIWFHMLVCKMKTMFKCFDYARSVNLTHYGQNLQILSKYYEARIWFKYYFFTNSKWL